jgi:hypothetical protein
MIYDTKPQTKISTRDPIRKMCLNIVEYEYFDTIIAGLVILNAINLSLYGINLDET